MNMNPRQSNVRFSCTALAGTSKQGILPQDPHGYYTMPVGGLNVFNSVGDYYPYEGAKELFQSSGAFMRRIKTGCLKGEYGHPKMVAGQSMESFAQRVMTIEEKNTCVHFSDIWLDFDKVKDETGRPVIAIMAKLKPTGPYGQALEQSLQNPKEEVCFSIRAFTEDVMQRGTKQRNLREIVSWDFVTEPGLNVARKYKSPALESYVDQPVTKEDILGAMKHGQVEGMAMESTRIAGLSLINALGWDVTPGKAPHFLNW